MTTQNRGDAEKNKVDWNRADTDANYINPNRFSR